MRCCWRRSCICSSLRRICSSRSISTGCASITTNRSARTGVFDRAVSAIKAAKAKGFTVNVNATIFDGHAAEDIAAFLDLRQGARRRRVDLARLRL